MSKEKVAILIVNYNMPERADALYKYLSKHAAWPHDIILIDNGSDLIAPSQYTNFWLPQNRQTTGGWMAGLRYATAYEKYFAYMFLITSAEYTDKSGDPLTPLAKKLKEDKNAVGVHAALSEDSTTAWGHMKTRGGSGYRRTWMLDNIAALYRADWFDGMGRFDENLIYGWGIDLETCYKARRDGRGLYICEDIQIKKVTDIAYTMDRMNMSAEERRIKAAGNMDNVMTEKYGRDWRFKIDNEFVEAEWR